MIALLLIRKIIQLFLIMFLGYILVKFHALKAEESVVLSKIALYLLMPCAMLNSFQVDFTPDVRDGLIFGFVIAALILILLIGIGKLSEYLLHMDVVEKTSISYSNSGNLIIPLVSAVLGPDWIIYSSSFLSVQLIFMWTHCVGLFAGKGNMNLKKILLNPNMLAIFAGIFMLISGLRPPALVNETLSSMGDMLGPTCMLVTGMLVADMDFKEILSRKRIYLVIALRMLVCPALVLLLLKLSHGAALVANGDRILLITFLAAMAPSASSITQFAQLYDRDAVYAGAINILTTLICIITMPMFVFLYDFF